MPRSPWLPEVLREPPSQVPRGRLGGVDVEELKARRVEALPDDVGEALEELVAELVVLLAFLPQAAAVEGDRPRELRRPRAEAPAVGGHEPRPAEDVAVVDRLDRDGAAGRRRDLDGDLSVAEDEEVV